MATFPETYGNFDLVTKFKLDFTDVALSKWRSRESGLTLLHLDYQAPIVKGYFVVASEIFDDTGRPHTLEHLVFMGSEKYPYKGVLDQLANRAFSAGTNAWTDTDHTAYTLATAGSQGFLQMLPIYLDHILYPTLHPSSFVTEVYHLDSEGHDSGVVYSEMQGRQNSSSDIMSLKMQRLRNPPGIAYRSETAGLMDALRVLDNESIKSYHSTYYIPQNLIVIVAGTVNTEALLKTLQENIEPSIVKHKQALGVTPSGWKRPFVETQTAERQVISSNVSENVLFPEQDETIGELFATFSGPPPNEFLTLEAIDLLATYLTVSATAPLNKEFVEVAAPLCTYIYFDIQARMNTCDLNMYVGSVPVEYLDMLEGAIREVLKRITVNGIDMDRMSMIIKRERRKIFNELESSKGDAFSDTVIQDFLYGAQDGSHLSKSLDILNRYRELSLWSNDQWITVLRKFFVDAPSIVVRARPSASFANNLASEEKARIEKRLQDIGLDGLARAGKVLADAKAQHDIPIPSKVISNFKVPEVTSISWIPVETQRHELASNKTMNKITADCDAQVPMVACSSPVMMQFDSVESDFVTLHALFTLNELPKHLLPYLSLYQATFFTLPIKRSSGLSLTHEEVVDALDRDTVSYGAGLGFDGSFPHIMRFTLKLESVSYQEGISWLQDLLFGSDFSVERLQVAVAKMLQSLPEMRRDAESVMEATTVDLLYEEKSTIRANSLFKQINFLSYLSDELKTAPDTVVSALEELRSYFRHHQSVRFAAAGNVRSVTQPQTAWIETFKLSPQVSDSISMVSDSLNALGKKPQKTAIVMSLPSIESSFATHVSSGPKGFNHPEWAAVRVAQELLNALESYLWRYIRGSGLAYGSSIRSDLESGQVSFSLYRSPNSFKAYQEAKKVLQGLTDKSIPLDLALLEAAKSSLVYSVARQVSTPGKAAMTSYINQEFKGVAKDEQRRMLGEYQAVKPEEVLQAIEKYFLPIFDASSSVAIVVATPGKTQEIGDLFATEGYEVQYRSVEGVESEGSDDGSSGSESMSED